MSRGSLVLKVGGFLLLAGGVQSLGFQAYVDPQIGDARTNLSLLQQELPGNHLVNGTLETLRDLRRFSADEVRQRQTLQLRQDFIQTFAEDPRLAIGEFSRVVGGFAAQSPPEEELLTTLRQNLARLDEMYSDHFAVALSSYSSPPFWFQPSAAVITAGASGRQALEFNHALYLMLTGERGAANSIFDELRENAGSDLFSSRILFAQSRLHFDAYRVEKDPEYHRQAVQFAEQSLRHDAGYEQPKLFLEYLLAIDLQAAAIEGTPREGQGAGEAEGERGAISADPPEH